MSKELEQKQIEEIKNVLMHTCKRIRTREDDIMQDQYAKALYNANYRKQIEGEWKDCFDGKYANATYLCSICGKGTLLKPDINELGNAEIIQALSPFCPNCGAKMEGGTLDE